MRTCPTARSRVRTSGAGPLSCTPGSAGAAERRYGVVGGPAGGGTACGTLGAEVRSSMESILVAGGAGFIGSNFVRLALARTDARVLVLDRLTNAGNLRDCCGSIGPTPS